MFDWVSFLERQGIEYVTQGPNVAKNNINVHCPMCGAGDPSHHLGISLVGKWWGCWRDPSHRGTSTARLIQLLLSCSWEQAQRLAGETATLPGDILAAVEEMLKEEAPYTLPARSLKMPDSFLPFSQFRSARYYRQYLSRRGYSEKMIDGMTEKYGLRYCKEGPFGGRIIFPVFYEGKLVTWTGRSIFPSETLRYKTLTVDTDRAKILGHEPAAGNISEFLLWYDDVAKGSHETLVIVEGPFDALRLRAFGEKDDRLIATCFFTSAPSRRQMDLLFRVLPKYRKRYLLLDEGTLSKSLALKNEFDGVLSSTDVEVLHLPEGVKDPGDLSKKDFLSLFAYSR